MRKIIVVLSLLCLIAGLLFAIDIPTTGNGFVFHYVTEFSGLEIFDHWFSDTDNNRIENNTLSYSDITLPEDGICFRFHLKTNLAIGLSATLKTTDNRDNPINISGGVSLIDSENDVKHEFEFKSGSKETSPIIIDNISAGETNEYVYQFDWNFDRDDISMLSSGTYSYVVTITMDGDA